MRIPTTALAALMGTTASAHMQMQVPAPLNSKFNPHTPFDAIDYSMTSPLLADGSDYPCKGYHSLLGTEAGRPTASFEVGRPASMKVTGGAIHNGGSCQISLSTDGARSFTVLKSIIGNCPADFDVDLGFEVPPDAPVGDAVLAWSWHNRVGNREMYMNCAAVTLTRSDSSSPSKRAADVSYSSRPPIFVANVANGCSVAEGGDVVYPDPGPDVIFQSTNPIEPEGNCGPSSSSSSSSATTFSAAEAGPALPPPFPRLVPLITKGRTRGHFKGRKGVSKEKDHPLLVSAADRPASAPAADAAQAPRTTLRTEVKKDNDDESSPVATQTPELRPEVQPQQQQQLDPAMDVSGIASPPGAPCAQDGAWGCLPDGRTFQRCAGGRWSVVMPVAPGTFCVAGYGAELDIRVL
ncbi:hypothetical protein VPNG_07861 [Cytospora leucostoma]|uniref:Chitin-binding type-4 domain-containing protein n=1 Tax=Cytospora leucostoma TaxID=1230097 RepID=A0A423WGU1_9PEZI|nr:hypothetical protein VPNG_07861 [Cytospora leucostoma]